MEWLNGPHPVDPNEGYYWLVGLVIGFIILINVAIIKHAKKP